MFCMHTLTQPYDAPARLDTAGDQHTLRDETFQLRPPCRFRSGCSSHPFPASARAVPATSECGTGVLPGPVVVTIPWFS